MRARDSTTRNTVVLTTALLWVGIASVVAGCSKRSEPKETPSSSSPSPRPTPTPSSQEQSAAEIPQAEATIKMRSVVLVTIDGARWQDMLLGADPSLTIENIDEASTHAEKLLPHLYDHVQSSGGVALGAHEEDGCGIVRQAGPSNVSLPGYIEILSGRRTACASNGCPPVTTPTILDDVAATAARDQPGDKGAAAAAASISSWERMDRAATATKNGGVLVSAGRHTWLGPPSLVRHYLGNSPMTMPMTITESKLAELVLLGERVDPYPGSPGTDYRPDMSTGEIAVEYLRTQKPRFLHVGFGDPDEHAHRDDYGGYLRSLEAIDDLIEDLVVVAVQGASPTTFIVTADHGRAANFKDHGAMFRESARSFVLAFQVGGGIASDPTPAATAARHCAAREILLPDIGATVRAVLGLPRDTAPGAGHPIPEIIAGQSS